MREQVMAERQTLAAERTPLLRRELARARNIIRGPGHFRKEGASSPNDGGTG